MRLDCWTRWASGPIQQALLMILCFFLRCVHSSFRFSLPITTLPLPFLIGQILTPNFLVDGMVIRNFILICELGNRYTNWISLLRTCANILKLHDELNCQQLYSSYSPCSWRPYVFFKKYPYPSGHLYMWCVWFCMARRIDIYVPSFVL